MFFSYDPVDDPPDLEPLHAAWSSMRNQGDQASFASVIRRLGWTAEQMQLPLFPCGSLVHVVARSHDAAAFDALDQSGATFDRRNADGQLPADIAAQEGNQAAARWLSDRGYFPTGVHGAPSPSARPRPGV